MSENEPQGRTVVGRVVSEKRKKSISVLVERKVQHPLYKKYIRRSAKYHAHDEENKCQLGDLVLIRECRPISKTKTWRLVRILERSA